jgi:hypothetical protein
VELIGKILEVKEGNTLISLHLQRENNSDLSLIVCQVASLELQIHNLNLQPLPMILLSKGFPFRNRSPQRDGS